MAYRNGPFGASEEQAISPFDPARDHSSKLTRGSYNLLMGGLVAAGFVVIALCGLLCSNASFLMSILQNYVFYAIGSLAVSIGGFVVIMRGMRREGFGMALAGYAMVVVSMGFTTGLILPFYDLPSIANAFVGTAIIAAVFTLAGGLWPQFFARIQGVLTVSLLALIVVSIVGLFMGGTWVGSITPSCWCSAASSVGTPTARSSASPR